MKKILSLVLILVLCFALTACGGKKETPKDEPKAEPVVETKTVNDGSSFGIDLMAEGSQKMSTEYASVDTLKKVRDEYLGGNTMFMYSNDTRTYADFVEYIGVDASSYQYNAGKNERTYIWNADGKDNSYFAAIFAEKDGSYVLYASSAANLG